MPCRTAISITEHLPADEHARHLWASDDIRGAVDAEGAPIILDGQDSIRLICTSGEGDDTVFENLVISNGSSTDGGGMFVDGGNPSLRTASS